eukprot:TCALIF_13336-PA protein Name:"Similar to cut-1 Cuticlin-1 (Caenorhabditis elegans)" AED:0.08 eAED:0.08 QI:0/0.75/0.55/0.88/1/1/9/0/640
MSRRPNMDGFKIAVKEMTDEVEMEIQCFCLNPEPFGGSGSFGGQSSFGGSSPGPGSSFGGSGNGIGGGGFDPWQVAQPANMAQIQDLQVQCEKDLMRVRVVFDRPFYGMIFSKGHYSNVNCVHVPSGLGQTQATFDISLRACGMTSSSNDGYGAPTPQGSFIENTVIIQYDPLLQEVWDQARKLRCTWYDFYEKAVTFKPYQVDMLDPVTANFLGDNLRCWMQIQVGKGPHASEVSGIVKIGQTMTMVLGVKDDENKFDMMVRNCVAHDGQRSPIQLVDEKGCVVRSKIMSPFKKVKNFDSTANVLSYAYFQAFKFPDSMNVHFQCVVQVCRGSCPDPVCGGDASYSSEPSSGYSSGSSSSSYSGPSIPASSSGFGTPNQDSYGSPQGAAVDSYGSPQGSFISNANINPRLPIGGNNVYTPSGSERKVSIVKPDGTTVEDLTAGDVFDADEGDEETPDRIALSEPGYEGFNKRIGGAQSLSLGGRPRSLELEDLDKLTAQPLKSGDAISATETSKNTVDSSVGKDHELKTRGRRSTVDSNGNRILRTRREADTDMADIETEKTIRVLAPNDVQFSLPLDSEDQDEVVINTDSPFFNEAVCIDTPAFIGVTISFLMILIVALITIIFLWMRIRSLDRKNLL